MIKVEHMEVFNFDGALRGMRNPMNSWDKSDTVMSMELRHNEHHAKVYANIGKNDLDLMRRLCKAGSPHRKYLRQIFVSMDITAPLYWWKEFDTYKVGTTADSCSTMHKIHSKEFELDDFSTDHLEDFSWNRLDDLIIHLNTCREKFLETKDKKYWWQIIQLLPSSYNQKRTVTFTYETVFNMLEWRQNHKLDEWCEFCEILKDLPYVREIGGIE